jgi:CubicO group peptidase (beta-lactamase class C family)
MVVKPSKHSSDTKTILGCLRGQDALVREILSITRTPGLAFGVIHDNEVVHAQPYGLADASNNSDCTIDTLFPIASITKVFTATACALLVLDGLLDWGEHNEHRHLNKVLIEGRR